MLLTTYLECATLVDATRIQDQDRYELFKLKQQQVARRNAKKGDAAAARFLTTYADAADVTRAVSGLVRATRPACELDDARRSVVQEAVAA